LIRSTSKTQISQKINSIGTKTRSKSWNNSTK